MNDSPVNVAGFKVVPPLEGIAELDNDSRSPRYAGKVWLNSDWLDLDKARALRDWLDKVIP